MRILGRSCGDLDGLLARTGGITLGTILSSFCLVSFKTFSDLCLPANDDATESLERLTMGRGPSSEIRGGEDESLIVSVEFMLPLNNAENLSFTDCL